jgi:hypothetical protein
LSHAQRASAAQHIPADVHDIMAALLQTPPPPAGDKSTRKHKPKATGEEALMFYETADQKRTIQRWCRLAIQLNGAIDTGEYGHVTVAVVVKALQHGDVFELLKRELPLSVWDTCKLTDVDRHVLAKQWRRAVEAYEPCQFHVERNGLALLVAMLVGMVDKFHSVIPT